MPPIPLPNALFWLCQGPKGGYAYNAQCIANLHVPNMSYPPPTYKKIL
jgi:hypothetical protein